MTHHRPYVGRFAPSPTGRLHLGSMVAAVANGWTPKFMAESGLCAWTTWIHRGRWQVRQTTFCARWRDLDSHGTDQWYAKATAMRRIVRPWMAWSIRTLRLVAHAPARFGGCRRIGSVSRFCRDGLPQERGSASVEVQECRAASVTWDDRMQGLQSVEREAIGDVTVLRADGHWAYHLAVVVDDAAQGITDVVEGRICCHPRGTCGTATSVECGDTQYAHVPVMHNEPRPKAKQANQGCASGGQACLTGAVEGVRASPFG